MAQDPPPLPDRRLRRNLPIAGSSHRHHRPGPLKLLQTTSERRRCCRWRTRHAPMLGCHRGIEAATPLFCPTETPSPGRRPPLMRWPETRRCERRNTWANRSREIVAETTAETKMHCMKLLGQRLMTVRRVAQIQVRIAIMNGDTTLGIPVTDSVVQIRPGKGGPRPSDALCMYGCPRWCKTFLNGSSV